jgi:3-hydroxyisobutyrate dehydrogenase-like beta-hydroxyacid dehydrogenase
MGAEGFERIRGEAFMVEANNSSRPTVGFIGLGNMGNPMCRQLLNAGYTVFVYDVDSGALGRFDNTPAQTVSSLPEIATETEVLFLSLPNSEIVEKAILGEEGVIGYLSSGQTLIDLSSSKPLRTQALAECLVNAHDRTIILR